MNLRGLGGLLPLLALAQTLLVSAVAPSAPSIVTLADPIDRDICEFASRLDPDGANSDRDGNSEGYLSNYVVDDLIDANGKHIKTYEQGTADTQDFKIWDKAGKQVEVDDPAADDTRSDFGTKILPYRGNVYILSYNGRKPAYLHSIKRLMNDGSLRPLCFFHTKADATLAPYDGATDWPLCQAAEGGKVEYIGEKKVFLRRSFMPGLPAGSASAETSVDVDFRNNGKPVKLLRLEESSGAGAGCDVSVFRPANRPAYATNEKLLDKMQAAQPDEYGCDDAKSRWFKYEGKSYLEVRSAHWVHPEIENDEYWYVSTISKGKPKRVCEASYERQAPTIISVWNGKEWKPGLPEQ